MKKLSFLLLLVLTATFLFGCNSASDTSTTVGSDGIAWSDTAADKDLVGAWEIDGSTTDEVYIFTEYCTVHITRGSVYMQGDLTYGIDTDGNHKLFSEFYYMAGEFDYAVNGDTAVFTREDGVTQTFKKIDYTEPQLTVYENFNAENPLVGTWHNEEYNDTYVFYDDGTATYEFNDVENVCLYHIDYTYTEEDGNILLTYDAGAGVEESSDSYTITGDTLTIIGLGEYTRQ